MPRSEEAPCDCLSLCFVQCKARHSTVFSKVILFRGVPTISPSKMRGVKGDLALPASPGSEPAGLGRGTHRVGAGGRRQTCRPIPSVAHHAVDKLRQSRNGKRHRQEVDHGYDRHPGQRPPTGRLGSARGSLVPPRSVRGLRLSAASFPQKIEPWHVRQAHPSPAEGDNAGARRGQREGTCQCAKEEEEEGPPGGHERYCTVHVCYGRSTRGHVYHLQKQNQLAHSPDSPR